MIWNMFFRFAAAAVALAAAVSCSPQFFSMDMQVRRPSNSGFNLAGKSIGVVYITEGKDSVFAKNLAEGFASSLEKDYFGGENEIGIYCIERTSPASYASRDTLVDLIVDTEKDVIFLFDPDVNADKPGLGDEIKGLDSDSGTRIYQGSLYLPIRVYAYDSMAKTDSVRVFKFVKELTAPVVMKNFDDWAPVFWEKSGPSAARIGEKTSEIFLSNWRDESIVLFYYESLKWEKASIRAYDFKWQEAIKIWMELAKEGSGSRRAHAAYNIAAALYVMGDYALSDQWLQYSDSLGGTDYSFSLRDKLKKVK